MIDTFTPGPWGWVIHDHSMATLGVLPDPGLGNPMVLTVSPCEACAGRADPPEWKWGRCHTPSEADARLISTSPDLLEALEAVMNEYEEGYGLNCVEQIRVAIAKAKGDTP